MGSELKANHSTRKFAQYSHLHVELIISTKIHKNLPNGIGGVIRTNFATDRQTEGQKDRKTHRHTAQNQYFSHTTLRWET